ncbi:hypothetical protein LUZ60_002092 [Juncus effusus]|nr:hypothetical protein LUZ60_002092 [Juncus effusus]
MGEEQHDAADQREESPKLIAVLKETEDLLLNVKSKVESLTMKVKENQLPTSEGISYLEAKQLLLLNYCQSIVYYVLRKAKGLSIESHPVVRNLIEIRLFLEKIRPIDKKLDYQFQKLTKAAEETSDKTLINESKEKNGAQKDEDPLKFRPNPENLVTKTEENEGGIYRPPKFAPTSIEDEDKISKKEKQALRREKQLVRQAKQSSYINELMTDFEDRPEEVRETIGAESRELTRYLAKREAKEREEEELFTRAPITRREKKQEKHMQKSRNGLLGLADGFYDEIKMLPLEEGENESPKRHSGTGGRKNKKQKKARF